MARPGLVLHAVGDIAIGDHPLCAGFGTYSRCRTEAADFPFRHVSALLRQADVVFGNLECTLSEDGLRPRRYDSMQMRGHPRFVEGLAAARFDVLNVANNHSLQHGRPAFRETIDLLTRHGIAPVGVAAAPFRNGAPVLIERQGFTVGFLGYSMRPRQYFTEEPLYAEGREPEILEEVRAARGTCDAVIVSLHWGDEFIDYASPEEMALAHRVMDEGADLVIGHHPHVLRGVEKYGRGYIVYSLGNFVCDMFWGEELRETAVLQCTLTPDGVSNLRLIPVGINDACQPVPLAGPAATRLEARLAALDARLRQPSDPPVPEAIERYRMAADEAQRAERKRAHRYFLRNVHRFPPGLLAQQLATFLRNRRAELAGSR